MADHGYPQDVKVNMTEDDSNSAPPPFSENELVEPLLANQEKSQEPDQNPVLDPAEPRSRCSFRDRFRRGRRCNSEQRAQCKNKARKVFRRFFAAIMLVWFYLAFISDDYDEEDWSIVPYPGNDLAQDFTPTWQSPVPPMHQPLDVFYNPAKDFASDDCSDNLVPWDGPSTIKTNLQTIRLGFGKGNMASNVIVRSGDVKSPTIRIRANVTKVGDNDDDDDDDDDGDDNDDDDNDDDGEPSSKRKGLHLKIKESEESFEVSFWADRYVRDENDSDHPHPPPPPEDPQPPHRKHSHSKHKHRKHHKHHFKNHGKHHKHHKGHKKHKHRDHDGDNDEEMTIWMKRRDFGAFEPEINGGRYKRFCAVIEVELILPASKESLYSVTIGGVVLSTKVEDAESIGFKELIVGAVIGNIETGSIYADSLATEVLTGTVSIESVQVATEGFPLRVKSKASVGAVKLNAKTAPIAVDGDDDDDDDNGDDDEGIKTKCTGEGSDEDDGKKKHLNHHLVIAGTTTGSIDVDISEASEETIRTKGETVPGFLVARVGSTTGHVTSSIDLVKGRGLHLKTWSTNGKVKTKVSDKYLGKLRVGALVGEAEVTEAKDSKSVIEYEKFTSHSKVGLKFIDDEGDEISGKNEIVVGTVIGDSYLKFF
ncbi:hypothetical protein BGX27_001400 [Mortierella sp. AM989]|nr:hypothetical protein BGX27_001400 [Mortierella sp. AM989]